MSRRRRAGPGQPRPTVPAPAPVPRSPRRAHLGLAAACLAAAVVFASIFLLGRSTPPELAVAFPAPAQAAVPPAVSRADFVGAARCAGCHSAQYAAWRGSTHGRAGGPPGPDLVLAPFNGKPLRFLDAVVTPRVTGDGRYVFDIEQAGRPRRVVTVDDVVGGGHMAGGGTQGFLTRWADGTWRFLPFDFSRQAGVWFCNTNTRQDRGWQPITSTMPLAACGDWTPTRVMGDVPRFANCQGCHGSQVEASLDTTTHRYRTAAASLTIDCESCHGPARRHVTLAASQTMARSRDVGMPALATLGKDQSMGVCYQCHALKDQLRPGYLPGEALERFYSTGLPLLGDRTLGPDGRVRTFSYQENQRYSECYRKGGMRCTDCHDPHTQGYRTVDGAPLPGRLDDRQCTSCHASLATAPAAAAHSGHRPDSPGNRCVACHMPYLQHPEVGRAIAYARADHTIPVPRPLSDSALGVASACAGCHANLSATALQRRIESIHGGSLKPRPAAVEAQIALGAGDPTAAQALAMLSDDEHHMATVAGLGRLVDSFVGGRDAWLDGRVVSRLRVLAAHPDPDVAALSLAALHLDPQGTARSRAFLAEALRGAQPHDGALRDRWAVVLGYVGDRRAAAGDGDGAVVAYRKALEISPANPRLMLSLANAERDAARDASALSAALRDYAEAVRLDPASALALVNQGIAFAAAGDTLAAVASWERARSVEPGEPLAPFNLGNVQLVRGRYAEAAAAYRAAIAADEALAPAHFNLGRALASVGRYDAALRAILDGMQFDSTDADARAMVQMLRARRGSPGAAPTTGRQR